MLLPGCLYCTGVISTYIQSYYRIDTSSHIVDDLLPACLTVNMFFMPLGSLLTQRNWDPRLMYLIGGSVAFPCFIGAAYMEEFSGFAALYIMAFSWNHGMTYMAPVHHGWLWFPNNAGMVSGIILSGFGAGPLIFDNLFTHLINPDNESIQDDGYYSKEIDDRFRRTFLIVVMCWLGIVIIASLLTFPGP